MLAGAKHYLYAAVFAVLAFCGVYLYNAGKKSEQNKQVRRRVDAMKTAKETRDEIMDDPYFYDRARKWLRDDER